MNSEFEKCGNLSDLVEFSMYSDAVSLGFICSTYAARDKIPNWSINSERLCKYFEQKLGRNEAMELMRGLV